MLNTIFRASFPCALLLFLTACQQIDPNTRNTAVAQTDLKASADPLIKKSPSDSRSYLSFTLANQLGVVVISDPEADKAAASLDVNVGSGDDPVDRAGLAHFLEHMLFLGTKKFPEAGSYQRHLSEQGGSHNAFTAFDHTNYFFEVNAEGLESTLDRFAQFFIAPLFTPKYVDREKHAVNSEYRAKIKNDSRRQFDILKQLINPEHPMSKFSVGSLETLADRPDQPIREDLMSFYRQHYSANRMKLVVLGRQSVEELTRMVQRYFAEVPNHGTSRQVVTVPMFENDAQPKTVYIEPVKDIRYLSLLFSLPGLNDHYRSKPFQYIANKLGHEGEYSLLAYLKQKGWAESLSAGIGISTQDFAEAYIRIGLTESGLAHTDEVIAAFFQTVTRLQEEGMPKWRFEEAQALSELAFRFQEKRTGMHYVTTLSKRMQDYPVEDILYAPFVIDEYRPDLVADYLNYFTPDNMLSIIGAKGVTTDQLSPYYDAPYRVTKPNEAALAEWQSPGLNPDIRLPEPNPFVPENLELVQEPSPGQPQRLFNEPGLSLWHQADVRFGAPRANIYLSVRSPIANDSARNHLLLRLYTKTISDNLNTLTYPAYLAGLGFELYPHIRGFTTKISGYSDKQSDLLADIIAQFHEPKIDAAKFAQFKDELERSIRNRFQNAPYERTFNETSKQLLKPSWQDSELLEALAKLSIDDLTAYMPALMSKLNVEVLAHGNISAEQALAMLEPIQQTLIAPAQPTEVSRGQIRELEAGANLVYSFPVAHEDTAIGLYVQGQANDFQERALFAMFRQVLSEPFYSELRTRQQLGYIVFATSMNLMETPAVMLMVQSPNTSPDDVIDRIQAFTKDFIGTLPNQSEQWFEQHKQGLIKRLDEQETRLSQISTRYWHEIDRSNFNFDSRQQTIEALKALDFMSFKQALAKHFDPAQGKKLTLVALGKGQTLDTSGFQTIQ